MLFEPVSPYDLARKMANRPHSTSFIQAMQRYYFGRDMSAQAIEGIRARESPKITPSYQRESKEWEAPIDYRTDKADNAMEMACKRLLTAICANHPYVIHKAVETGRLATWP
jgi:hypothetical protein